MKKSGEGTTEDRHHRGSGGKQFLGPYHPVHNYLGVLWAAQAIAAAYAAVIHDLRKALVDLYGFNRADTNTGVAAAAALFISYDRLHGFTIQ